MPHHLLQTEDEGIDSLTSSLPPPLMPKPPHASPLHQRRQLSTEGLFPNDMEMTGEDSLRDNGRKLMDISECPSEISSRDSPDSDTNKLNNGSLMVDSQRPSSGPSPDLSEVSSVSQEDSKTSGTEIHPGIERRHSYQMATDDVEPESCLPDSTKDQEKVTAKSNTESIKRSTSSVDNSSQATIKLRRSLESAKSPRAVSTSVYSGSLYQSALERMSSNAKDSAYFSLKSSTWAGSLDQLIDKEVNTSPYPTPLIGCIPPSALKCFAEKQKKAAHSTSPTHRHSGINYHTLGKGSS